MTTTCKDCKETNCIKHPDFVKSGGLSFFEKSKKNIACMLCEFKNCPLRDTNHYSLKYPTARGIETISCSKKQSRRL